MNNKKALCDKLTLCNFKLGKYCMAELLGYKREQSTCIEGLAISQSEPQETANSTA